MWRNALKAAWRTIWRNKLHTSINILGLALGIGTCIVIYLLVNHELSFDTHRPDKERIYRVTTRFSGSFDATNPGVSTAVEEAILNNLVGFEETAFFHTFQGNVQIGNDDQTNDIFKNQRDLVFCDPSYFKVIGGFEWLIGSPTPSLTTPNQVVLTESKAKDYFGALPLEAIVGQTLVYADSLPVTVSGILQDPSQNTDFAFGDYLSFSTIENSWIGRDRIRLNDWDGVNSNAQLFVKLEPGHSQDRFEEQLKSISNIYANLNPDISWQMHLELQPLTDLHFNSKLRAFGIGIKTAHKPTLRILMLVAFLLLFIAGVNFVNLETAKATERAKEVGVRKTLGADRKTLIGQFLGETFVITGIALSLALVLTNWSLAYFAEFIPKGVQLELFHPQTLIFLAVTLITVGLAAGIYPAFILSSFQPVRTLKKQLENSKSTRKAYLRKALIVFQFAVAQILIIGTLLVNRQIDFMVNKELGFRKDAIITFYHPLEARIEKRELLRNNLAQIPQIIDQSLHQSPPAQRGYNSMVVELQTEQGAIQFSPQSKPADSSFIHLYEIPLIAGRNLIEKDSLREYLVNETFLRQAGITNPIDIVNREIIVDKKPYPIVGVVKDFHAQSLHNPFVPLVIHSRHEYSNCHSVKLATTEEGQIHLNSVIDKVGQAWKQIYPDIPFEYSFLDESIADFYANERKTAKLMQAATLMAIFISCLGLFGLASFTATQRVKEIGIRKVLGASVANIVQLISSDFIKLVLIGIVIASPLGWLVVKKWLSNFAFPAEMEWWNFFFAGLTAISIALLTVAFQSIKAAIANPVDSLRNE